MPLSWPSAARSFPSKDFKEKFAKSEVDMLNIVIKGDSSGSVEALEDSLMKIEVSDEVGIQVIHRGVGAITQNDVNLATVDKAVIIGFNVRPNRQVADLAEREGVEIKYYSVIYRAIEDIEASLKGMLKPEYEEVVTSHSEIREIFRSSKFGNIAGVMVQDGEVKRGTKCRILRNGVATGQRPRDLLAASFQGRRSPPSRKATRLVSTSAPSTTSRSAISSRPSKCGKSSVSSRVLRSFASMEHGSNAHSRFTTAGVP